MISLAAQEFSEAWDRGEEHFYIQSSGSTSAPKTIELKREWMEWSARQTAQYIQPQKGETVFCCLPLNKVGGLMVLVRSKVWDLNLMLIEPLGNPLINFVDADIVSLTPYQMHQIIGNEVSKKNLLRFREVLIGGSEIPSTLEAQLKTIDPSCQIRQSYGMSETYSHVAVRNINGEHSNWFQALEGVKIEADSDGSAIVYAPFCVEGLRTNDLIRTNLSGQFQVIGRKDFTINSGGVKLQIEVIEKAIEDHFPTHHKLAISSIKDDQLGEKLVLVCEDKSTIEALDFGFLAQISPYAIPKKIIEISEIPYNEGGKIDRLKIKLLISN